MKADKINFAEFKKRITTLFKAFKGRGGF